MLTSPIAAASSTSTRRAARCCLCLNAGGSPEANSTWSWTRAATLPCSSPPGISLRACPIHFSGQDLRRGTRQPLPIAAHHVPLGEPLDDDDDDPHSLPHQAGHHCHKPRWQQNSMDLLHGRVYRARQSRVPGPPSGDACPHPARLRAAQHHGRVPAARQTLHETLQGRAGPILGTLRWSGTPTPSTTLPASPTALLACAASSCAGPVTR